MKVWLETRKSGQNPEFAHGKGCKQNFIRPSGKSVFLDYLNLWKKFHCNLGEGVVERKIIRGIHNPYA